MKKRTSKAVFASALLALARQEPIARITVKQIVETSGLSLQTFYNHFRDKEDLILWIHRSEGERMLARLNGRNYHFHDLIMDNIRFCRENSNFLQSTMGSDFFNRYGTVTAESAFFFLRAYILRRIGLEEMPEDLAFYLRMYVFSCLHILTDPTLACREIPDARLAQYLEDGMPEKLRSCLLD